MQLPLFPLNMVLFPEMPAKLHIFEDRYKLMINECVENNSPFGIVLIQEGRAELAPIARPYDVGMTVHVTDVQRLPFGRMNIVAHARDRFIINSLDYNTRDYLVADVELTPMRGASANVLENADKILRPLLTQYIQTLKRARQIEDQDTRIPSNPLSMAYLAAFIAQTDNTVKQELLESDTVYNFLVRLIQIYQLEIALLEVLRSPATNSVDSSIPFSLN